MTAFPFRSCWAPHLPHLALGSVFSFALSATSIQIRYPSNFAIPVSQMSSVMQQGNRAGATMTPALGRGPGQPAAASHPSGVGPEA